MAVILKYWSEDGDVAAVDVPASELATQLNPLPTKEAAPSAVPGKAPRESWTMPDDPDHFGDFA